MPQLITQFSAIVVIYGLNQNNQFVASPVQIISIITSTISLVMAILKFVLLKRSNIFISPIHPTLSSSAPLGLLILLTILIGTIGFFASFELTADLFNFRTIVNALVPIYVFLIFAIPFSHRCWIIPRNIFYLLLATSCAVVNILMAICHRPSVLGGGPTHQDPENILLGSFFISTGKGLPVKVAHAVGKKT